MLHAGVPLASVIIPTWNGAHLLPSSLDSLLVQTYARLEVVVVDGGSQDNTQNLVATHYPTVRFVALKENRGFAGNVNAGFRHARGDVVLLLNNDAEASPTWVESLVNALAEHPRHGAVASRILYVDGRTINSAGDGLTRTGEPFQYGHGQATAPQWEQGRELFGASGGAVAYRRSMLQDVGVLDDWFFAYLEDVDLAFRAQLRGWACWYEPMAVVRHRGSATGGGPLASYYNGRNLVRLLVKNVPTPLVRRMLPGALAAQVRRARDAALAWRGNAARATLQGQAAGLLALPSHLTARRKVQGRRIVSDEHVWRLLAPSKT